MRRKTVLLLLLHLAAAVLALSASWEFLFSPGAGGNLVFSARAFRYFTIDSNLLAALSSLLLLPYLPRLSRGAPLPDWLWTVRLASTAAVAVTLATVMLFLAPIRGYDYMLDGPDLYLHLICPVLYILSFVLLEGKSGVPARGALWGVLPVFVYGLVYMYMVVAHRRWPDFYFLNRGDRWYLSALIMVLATAGISLGLWAGNRRR